MPRCDFCDPLIARSKEARLPQRVSPVPRGWGMAFGCPHCWAIVTWGSARPTFAKRRCRRSTMPFAGRRPTGEQSWIDWTVGSAGGSLLAVRHCVWRAQKSRRTSQLRCFA